MENEKISDKLAGHAPAKMVGGKRVQGGFLNTSFLVITGQNSEKLQKLTFYSFNKYILIFERAISGLFTSFQTLSSSFLTVIFTLFQNHSVSARVRNNSSTSKLVDTTNVVKANVGGFDGNVVTEKVEKDELAPSDVKSTDGGKSDHVQKHAPVPKNQQSHKPAMNQNINQPKNF